MIALELIKFWLIRKRWWCLITPYRVRHNYGNTHFTIVIDKKKVYSDYFLDMLMTTIILNKYQQHLFNFSSLVFNNSLQSTLESFACSTQLFLGNQVLFSSQVRLSIFWLFVFYPDLVDCIFSLSNWTFLPPCKPFHGEYVASREGGIAVALLVESYNRISIYPHFPT